MREFLPPVRPHFESFWRDDQTAYRPKSGLWWKVWVRDSSLIEGKSHCHNCYLSNLERERREWVDISGVESWISVQPMRSKMMLRALFDLFIDRVCHNDRFWWSKGHQLPVSTRRKSARIQITIFLWYYPSISCCVRGATNDSSVRIYHIRL